MALQRGNPNSRSRPTTNLSAWLEKLHPPRAAQPNPTMESANLAELGIAGIGVVSIDGEERVNMSDTSKAETQSFSQEYNPTESSAPFPRRGANAVSRIKDEMRNNFLPVLVGSVAVSFLTGYLICQQREAQQRDQWAETLFRQLKDWLRERGRKAAVPVQEGLDYARSAAKRAPATQVAGMGAS